jgi:hypothetical protein
MADAHGGTNWGEMGDLCIKWDQTGIQVTILFVTSSGSQFTKKGKLLK